MLLGTKPATVLTHEQNIAWSLSEIISELENPTISDTVFPIQITESQGYYPSEVISVQPVRTVDGGFRHIYRVVMPISAASYSGSRSVWEFVRPIAPGMSRIGIIGCVIPGTSQRVRFNTELSNGTVEYLSGSNWINIANGSNVRHAWIGGDGNIYIKIVDGTYYYVTPGSWTSWLASTELVFKTQIAAAAAIRL